MSALSPGSLIHRYEVEQVLGAGAFGIVYLARHKSLGYQVVIKEYLPEALACRLDGQVLAKSAAVAEIYHESLQRFTLECETLLKLDHDNIVFVYDCFYASGTAYMVMQYESGTTLWQHYATQVQQQQQPFSWWQLSQILPGVFAGLHYMHQRQIVHRDIKPGNIFLRTGTKVHPLIIDFGAVKQAGGYVSQYAQNTPAYCALEQEYGIHPIGPWTDIHALGVMMAELLTMHRPQTAYQRQQALLAGEADSMSQLLLYISDQGDARLAEALYFATRLDPTERFQSISDFKAALPTFE
ncbi:serine/threonine protein kinase [Arsukibacterium sp.]|uniref:serine/threonine protein kinase n=1 Tax=Arsukibacterium sp. TaxID=1977258 RepID=UPI002FD8B67C